MSRRLLRPKIVEFHINLLLATLHGYQKNCPLEMGLEIENIYLKFCGPLKITHRINEETFRLDLSQYVKARKIRNAFHVSLLRPFMPEYFERTKPPPPPLKSKDQDKECDVESIQAHRKYRGKANIS